MKHWRKYKVYIDDGRDVFAAHVSAPSEAAARQYVAGNGDVIAVKDVTADFPISEACIDAALRAARFGEAERMFIERALAQLGLTETA